MRLFHERADYIAFQWLLAEACDEVDLPVLAVCAMPNHIHVVVQPRENCDLAQWTHWLFTTHARRYHKKYDTSGSVWEGRYKASLVQQDEHLLTVLRYVERNALAANLVRRAEQWEWGSLRWRLHGTSPLRMTPSPLPLPSGWTEFVNAPQSPAEIAAIHSAIERQAPYGDDGWRARIAVECGLEQTIAPRGRPRRAIVTMK